MWWFPLIRSSRSQKCQWWLPDPGEFVSTNPAVPEYSATERLSECIGLFSPVYDQRLVIELQDARPGYVGFIYMIQPDCG